jgi:hypothetical protein
MAPASRPALLDCTCELPRMLEDVPYHNLPMWDTHGGRQPPSLLLSMTIHASTILLHARANKHAC